MAHVLAEHTPGAPPNSPRAEASSAERSSTIDRSCDEMGLDVRINGCELDQNPAAAPRYHAPMTGEGLRQDVVRVLRAAVPGLRLVLLFGSHARGDETPASDVDVALLAPAPLATTLVNEAREALEQALGRDVHLVDLRTASTVLRHEVTRHGEVLHTDGSGAVEQFLDFVLRDYVRLNEERAGILEDIGRRGRVHGR
jgi:uncharacterized protein